MVERVYIVEIPRIHLMVSTTSHVDAYEDGYVGLTLSPRDFDQVCEGESVELDATFSAMGHDRKGNSRFSLMSLNSAWTFVIRTADLRVVMTIPQSLGEIVAAEIRSLRDQHGESADNQGKVSE